MKHEIVEKNIGLMIVLIILTISGGFLAEVVPLFFQKDVNAATFVIPSRSVRSVTRLSGMATTPLRASLFMTARSCGAPSAPVRIWPVLADATPMPGSASICTTRAA